MAIPKLLTLELKAKIADVIVSHTGMHDGTAEGITDEIVCLLESDSDRLPPVSAS